MPCTVPFHSSQSLDRRDIVRFEAYMRLANICMGVRLTKLGISEAAFWRRLALLPHKGFTKPCKTWYLSIHLVVATTCDKQ